MAIGLIIIGDEILSGKRTDSHFSAVIGLLKERGMQLDWVKYLRDDPQKITAILRQSFATPGIVFCCGGIGATPDDHTRRCAAEALGVPLVLHPEARALILARICEIAARHGHPVDETSADSRQRFRMGEFPEGAKIIPNPVNRIPGFSVGTHYFLPGFPEMAHPMMAWALDTYHQADFYQLDETEKSLIAYGAVEAVMTPLLEEIERDFPHIKVFSLPNLGTDGQRGYVELGVKGRSARLDEAFARLEEGVRKTGAKYQINA